MGNIVSLVGLIGAFVLMVIVFGLLMALPVMWLWNGCLVPAVTGVHEIGWVQAWGISILCAFLFKSNSSK